MKNKNQAEKLKLFTINSIRQKILNINKFKRMEERQMIASFLKGAVAGVLGMAALSWLITRFTGNDKNKKTGKEE